MLYELLGVPENATPEEIKKAYKKKIIENHPDVEGGDEEKLKKIIEAYRVLSNANLRSIYDLQNLKGSLKKKHIEIYRQIEITLKESLIGCEKEIQIDFGRVKCSSCSGSGSSTGSQYVPCEVCSGHGSQVNLKNNGSMSVEMCQNCRGKGSTPIYPCKKCSGVGGYEVVKQIKIKIPAGMSENQIIRFSDVKNEAGNFIISVAIKTLEDGVWSRDGDDLKLNFDVDMISAYIGKRDVVIDPYGREIEMEIPPGIQTGDFQFYRGAGVNNKDGDLTINFIVKTPKFKNDRSVKLAQELLKEIQNIEKHRT